MDDRDSLRPALEHYRKKRLELLQQLKALEPLIRQLESDLGEASSSEDDDLDIVEMLTAPNSNSDRPVFTGPVGPALRPDEFFGMSQSDAAKAYLRKIGRAIPFSQLVVALKNGGAKLGGADPSKTLYVSLARNPRKEFVWPSKDHISLAEFYGKKDSAT